MDALGRKSALSDHDTVEGLAGEQYPCDGCGAQLAFAPGQTALVCPYCGHRQEIASSGLQPIQEHDYFAKVEHTIDARALVPKGAEVRCQGCGAISVVEGHADRCAFCDAPVVVEPRPDAVVPPESLLPFGVSELHARRAFRAWLKTLWFAPSDLGKRARGSGMDGVYLPYWTYDAETVSAYRGQRGTHYYVTESYTDSKGQRRTRRVQRTSWAPAAGVVKRFFDDVLICASNKLPRKMIRGLEPWDLEALVPFDGRFLSGFVAMRYDVELRAGFILAQERMRPQIEAAVRADIGGDVQRIDRLDVRHPAVHFQHFLLPVWISSFRYGQKVFRVVVNARTGEVAGERPWSVWKITLAVLAGLVVLGCAVWLYLEVS